MSNLYVYQIKGVLEKPSKEIGGIRVLVCSKDLLHEVDVPSAIFNKEVLAFLKYRLAINDYLNVSKLPYKLLKQLRDPIGQYLDNYILTHGNCE